MTLPSAEVEPAEAGAPATSARSPRRQRLVVVLLGVAAGLAVTTGVALLVSPGGDAAWHLGVGAALALGLAGLLVMTDSTPSVRGQRVVAWALLAAWLAGLVGAVLGGEHRSTADDLLTAISAGDVHEVEASGGLGPGGVGRATIELRWREHGIRHTTEVVQTRGRHDDRPGGDDVTGRFTGNLSDYLTQDGGTVDVVRGTWSEGSLTGRFATWEVHGRTALVLLGLLVLTLLHCGLALEPWRATPWAWVWLMLALAPIACPAYLLLGGPTGLFRPADPRRRLTGGWAFLLALVLGGLGSRA